jgi:hypothetical protein
VVYFPALKPPLKPSGPSRNIRISAFVCLSFNSRAEEGQSKQQYHPITQATI